VITQTTSVATSTVWRDCLPVLVGSTVSLREIELRDAASLHELISAPEVTRFISPPPDSREGFEHYITWVQEERQRGRHICFAVVPHGMDTAVGLFHLRRIDLGFETAEWGFALGSAFWGTGVFVESAELLLQFAFAIVGIVRLEARVAEPHGRGHGALRKIGAVQEAVLRKSFSLDGRPVDQALWAIVDSDYHERLRLPAPRVYVH
jgi:ribosomal-protein-alanine N-acetyltransferase